MAKKETDNYEQLEGMISIFLQEVEKLKKMVGTMGEVTKMISDESQKEKVYRYAINDGGLKEELKNTSQWLARLDFHIGDSKRILEAKTIPHWIKYLGMITGIGFLITSLAFFILVQRYEDQYYRKFVEKYPKAERAYHIWREQQ